MEDIVEQILSEMGPSLSGEVSRALRERHALSPAAARQRLARRSSRVKSIEHLPFPRNARFLYHKDDYGSPRFWRALQKALESSPAYACALGALSARGGMMPLQHFHVACGAPLAQKRHLSSKQVLDALTQAGLVQLVGAPGIGECVSYVKGTSYLDQTIAAMKGRLIVESIVLNAVKTWARNLGLGSYGAFHLRADDESNLPKVGTFAWDMTAPSYLGAVRGRSENAGPKPGFFVCDILLGRALSATGLRPFLRKCETLRALKGVGRCLQIFVAEGYSKEAFRLARDAGVIPATTETLFGQDVAAALVELSRVLADAARLAVDPVKFDRLFKNLGKIEGAANSLRGALFEFIVAEIVRKLWTANITLNHIFRDGGQDVAEVDVLAVLPNRSVHFIECKGHAPEGFVDNKEIDKWITRRIPTVRKKALEHPDWRHLDMHFELWTSGQLSDAARQRLATLRSHETRYKVTVCTAADVEALVAKTNDNALHKLVQQHFIEHPLAESPETPEKSEAA
nr:hypothetical protein [uncultured Steroidobacter sp.]